MDDYLVRMPRDSETYSGSAVLRFHDPRSERLRPMRVFAYFPEAVRTGKQTSVLFVMHGVHRNAEEMFQQIVPPDKSCSRDPLVNKRLLPELHNFVLLLPEFSAALFPERNAYNFGNVFRNAGDLPDTKSPHSGRFSPLYSQEAVSCEMYTFMIVLLDKFLKPSLTVFDL